MLLFLAKTVVVSADTDCFGYLPIYPKHYCECNNATPLSALPFDVQVTDSIWFKCSSKLFLSGFTAYLYSDCDVNFDIYQNCTSTKLLYSVVIKKNQVRDVTAESIKQKLEDAGVSNLNLTLRVCIYPVDSGNGGRLICMPYNTGYESTCSDILSLLPNMTFVSSHANDVYEITPENITTTYRMYMRWKEENNKPCHMKVTRGSCDGEVVAEHDFVAGEDSLYHFDPALLKAVRKNGEKMYAHFTHDAAAVGRISFNRAKFVRNTIDTTLCKGKEFRYGDYVTKTSKTYYYDTVVVSPIEYHLYGYKITFTEPEPEYDTIALIASELPYKYRGQYTVSGFGDHEVTIRNSGECNENVMLHVKRNVATVLLSQDTTLCYGKMFSYEGKNYVSDVTLTDSVWSSDNDTLYINALNVRFSPMGVVYDTLALTKKEVRYYKYEGLTIRAFGDYTTIKYDEMYCPDSLYLHVCHKVTDTELVIDTMLCVGDVYKHTDGKVYTQPITLRDSVWTGDDTRTITITNVGFEEIELAYDTLYLSYSELPYRYANQVEIEQMTDTTVAISYGKCSGDLQLHVVHKFATLVTEKDTTLCEGKGYEHNGVVYLEATTIVDSLWMNRDTFLIATTRVYFAAPEVGYDTLMVRVAELPYMYRGEEIEDFGEYDLTIRKAGGCDERVKLKVQHLVTTIREEKDTTLCEGKGYEHNGVVYSEATTIVDSLWMNRDTFLIATTRVYFATPEVGYDTLMVRVAELPYMYRGEEIEDFGEYDLTIRKTGECDERVKLKVQHLVTTIREEKDTTLCQSKGYEHNGVVYSEATTIVDSLWVNRDTFLIATTRVYFAAPEVGYDTLMVRVAELPYMYRGEEIEDFGEYDLTIRKAGECDERVKLKVQHLVTTIREEKDTTLCQGKGYEHNGAEYFETTTIVDSLWVNRDTILIATIKVEFVALEVEYDTVLVREADLQSGYYYELADVYIYAVGVYDYEITADGECTRKISLTVEKDIPSLIDEVEEEEKPKLIMIDGVIYIFYKGEYYTLLGAKGVINEE